MPLGFDAFIMGSKGAQPKPPAHSEDSAKPSAGRPSGRAPSHSIGTVPTPKPGNGRGPCTRCRRLRLKCCENRPCKFCIMKRCGDSCTDWAPQSGLDSNGEIHIFRPLDFQPIKQLAKKYPFKRPTSKAETVTELMRGGCGYNMDMINEMIAGCTPDLLEALHESLTAFRLMTSQYPAVLEYLNKSAEESPSGTQRLLGYLPEPSKEFRDQAEYAFTVQILNDEFSSSPVSLEQIDLKTGAIMGKAFNRRFAEALGVSAEELLARAGNHDFPVNFCCPDLDFLALTLDGVWATLSGHKHGCFYRCGTHKPLSRHGQTISEGMLWKQEYRSEVVNGIANACAFLTPIEPEEFDQALIDSPNFTHAFQRMAGDFRSGRQLVRDQKQDKRMTLKKLNKTEEGRLKLNAMAAAIRTRMHPVLTNAFAGAKALQEMYDSAGSGQTASHSPVSTEAGNSETEDSLPAASSQGDVNASRAPSSEYVSETTPSVAAESPYSAESPSAPAESPLDEFAHVDCYAADSPNAPAYSPSEEPFGETAYSEPQGTLESDIIVSCLQEDTGIIRDENFDFNWHSDSIANSILDGTLEEELVW